MSPASGSGDVANIDDLASTNDRPGRVDRAATRFYERFGSRVIFLPVAAGVLVGAALVLLQAVFSVRYLGISNSQAVSVIELWLPIELGAMLLGAAPYLNLNRKYLAWSGSGRTPERAPEAWDALRRYPHQVLRVAAVVSLTIPANAVYLVWRFHMPWWGVLSIAFGVACEFASVTVLLLALSELLLRPMLRDIATYLPSDFEPRVDGVRLRTKTLVPLPLVTFFAALTIGAYANLSRSGLIRYTLMIGFGVATIAVATVIFRILNRSALDPIDDLIAATERVRGGDLNTPVPVLSADELGALANSFNGMLAGLREREQLRAEVLRREEELRASRARIVSASDAERRRVERNIHDGAQQQLVALAVKLRMLQERVPDDDVRAALATISERLKMALDELRELARGLHPSVLTTDGLAPALEQLASRASLPVIVNAPEERFPEAVESTAYFVASEALANIAKYAQAHRAEVSVEHRNSSLVIRIEDDGIGGAHADAGSGLTGLVDRVAALDGQLTIESPAGHGTAVTAELPLT